jgi:hypothetical protein
MKSRTGQSLHGTAFSIFLPTEYEAGGLYASPAQIQRNKLVSAGDAA